VPQKELRPRSQSPSPDTPEVGAAIPTRNYGPQWEANCGREFFLKSCYRRHSANDNGFSSFSPLSWISLIGAQNVPHFWLQLVSVVLSVIVGVLFLRHPGEGLLTLTLLLIVFFMVEGMSKIIFALTIRPFPNWGWVLVSGVIGILLSFYLWASLPVTAIWLLGVLLGIQLICEGVALGYLAWQVRQS
jgi:hypothetical protein